MSDIQVITAADRQALAPFDAIIDVRLCFGADAFELHVSGPPAGHVELPVVLAAARERAALHAGVLDGRIEGGLCHATARVPLISGYA